jgi:hypothetical protein
MELFTQSLLKWQLFFSSVATASATLTGLLFVSLSLNRDKLKDAGAHPTLSIARNTFGDFLYVLMIALVFLVPHPIPVGLTIALLALGISSGSGLVIRELRQQHHAPRESLAALLILRRIGLPSVASIGLIGVAVAVAFGNYESIFALVVVIAALLITACWNAWLLLLQE